MPFYVKGTDTLIQGTSERVLATCSVTTDGAGGYTHDGTDTKVFWDSMETQTDENGETLFTTEDGEDVPWSMIEWRDA